ncbi:MORC family CW-type zinc finger protein 3-like [Ictalurus furcatus]|uniref:MORC family CW-type zinc finger protein 3-like n=1 Tax=Ictalurus furcatus TaxID=66913 RepID=UPI002350EF02|nr:MORC family CW-type zinc finger protein 3-like [Ictalurus furcatus]
MAAVTSRGIPLSSICPRFLHTNSTSHTWPFSAIAELIDNAYDPDVSAKQLWIDKSVIKDQDCLIFMDSGNGMDYDKMHKMLSFGFNDKQTIRGHVPVGLYGNGFKSGSMRLGKDAIMFSKKDDTMCVGLLSQTYLENTGAQNVIVPIVMFTNTGQTVSVSPEHAEESLHDILTHSLFNTKEELLSEFSVIDGLCTNSSGTRIIIWNLRRTPSGELEFDFTKNPYDIRIPVDVYGRTGEINKRQAAGGVSVPESEYSLRAYCSILYRKPRMQIIIQGKKVETLLVTKTLANLKRCKYKPDSVKKAIRIKFGYNTKSKEHDGLMMYHNNRLIKAYERVDCQRKADGRAVGVIGVIECNYLTPRRNKQDFDDTEDYRKTLKNAGNKLEEYWKQQVYAPELKPNCTEDTVKRPDQSWVQCDNCLTWRKLPDGIDPKKLPEKWFCHMNSDPQFRSCTDEEAPEDSDDEQPRNQKTYKQHERNQKLQQENWKQSPSTPCHPTHSSAHISSPLTHAGSRPSVDTQQTFLPITAVIIRNKRALGQSQENTEKKKARKNISDNNVLDSPSTSSASPDTVCSSSMCSSGNDANKGEWIKTETAPVDNGDDVIDKSMVNKEQRNQFTQNSSEDQQNFKVLYLQAKEETKQLQHKLGELEKAAEELKEKVDSLEKEKCTLLTYCESLEKDLEEESATSTETSNSGRGRDLQFWTEQHETHDKQGSGEENNSLQLCREQPDQNWIQCDDCLKWRKLPDCVDAKKLPKKWFCRMNPDPKFRSCTVEEEPEDYDDELRYQKTYKQHEMNQLLTQVKDEEKGQQSPSTPCHPTHSYAPFSSPLTHAASD